MTPRESFEPSHFSHFQGGVMKWGGESFEPVTPV